MVFLHRHGFQSRCNFSNDRRNTNQSMLPHQCLVFRCFSISLKRCVSTTVDSMKRLRKTLQHTLNNLVFRRETTARRSAETKFSSQPSKIASKHSNNDKSNASKLHVFARSTISSLQESISKKNFISDSEKEFPFVKNNISYHHLKNDFLKSFAKDLLNDFRLQDCHFEMKKHKKKKKKRTKTFF